MRRPFRALAVLPALAAPALAQEFQGIAAPQSIPHGQFGVQACLIPDATGDGKPEIGIGSNYHPHGPTILPPPGRARIFVYSSANGGYLGAFYVPAFNNPWSQAGLNDVNGDNLGDLAIGVPQFRTPGGRVHLYSVTDGQYLRALQPPNGSIGLQFGASVAGMPDVDGDGRGDVLVGATLPVNTFIPGPTGRVFLMSGATGQALRIFAPPVVLADPSFGQRVLSIPDVNADGKADVVVGGYGSVHVYNGATGARLYSINGPPAAASLVANAPVFGHAIASVPDLDNDGVADLVISNPSVNVDLGPMLPAFAPDAGAIYIYSGRTGVLRRTVLGAPVGMNRFGWSVAGVRDQNGDGRGDIVVGAPYNPDVHGLGYGPGSVYILSGGTGATLRALGSPNDELGGRFGEVVLGLPDLTGNGRSEVVITAPYEDPNGDPFKDLGRAYILRQ